MSEEAIYKLHRYPSGELEEFECVQKLVRCKECKYYYDGHWCSEWEYLKKNPDDFCSYGVKKGADDDKD